ncbi:MAG: hypothetical protein WKG06_09445 [Segetibacter sp.]
MYPAFVLSSINTVNSLKGKLNTVKENVLLRKSLVGFQFAIALVVLIAAAIVTQQVSYFFSQESWAIIKNTLLHHKFQEIGRLPV